LGDKLGAATATLFPLFWLASAFGLIKGILALVQPRGKKAMAVGGCILNGMLCLGPLGFTRHWTHIVAAGGPD
jgi:hypothetical protein